MIILQIEHTLLSLSHGNFAYLVICFFDDVLIYIYMNESRTTKELNCNIGNLKQILIMRLCLPIEEELSI